MAGGQERILRRRIRSVQSTKKITRAMELIAASRIVKAQQRVQAAVPYSEMITEAVADLAAAGAGIDSPYLTKRDEERRVGYVVLTADRGLCGAYNASVIRATEGAIKDDAKAGKDYALFLVGRKSESYFRFREYRIDASFTGFTEQPSYDDGRGIGQAVVDAFIAGEIDRAEVVYTRFVTAGSQEVVQRPLLPLERDLLMGGDARPGEDGVSATYDFEPSPELLLERLLPRYVEARIYAALLNAAASEQAARQRAMKAATDNADELITKLTRVMNRARQDSITTEIMEIVSGAEALRGGDADIDDVVVAT